MKKLKVCLIFITLLALSHSVLASELEVVATFSILQDFVKQVGGERVQVNSIITLGADPHTFEPTPKEAKLVARADLLVGNGSGLDDWLFDLMTNAARADVELIIVSEGLAPLGREQSKDKHHHGGDPHFWLSVPNAIFYVEQITHALITISPDDATYFEKRSANYIEELVELDQWMLEELEKIPQENRIIVTYHNAFSYLADRYGFSVVEFLVENPEAEPSPREIARLIRVLKEMKQSALFSEPQLSAGTRYMQTLVTESKGKLYTLYSDSLSNEISTYIEMMKYNTRTLVEALK